MLEHQFLGLADGGILSENKYVFGGRHNQASTHTSRGGVYKKNGTNVKVRVRLSPWACAMQTSGWV
jgi:hypothetical protein